MAERQDILKGKNLSPVQVRAVQILRFLDEIEKIKSEYNSLRLALVSGGYDAQKLWPEYKQLFKPDESSGDDSDEKVDFDYSNVEWKSPMDAKDEYDELMRKLQGLKSGKVNGSNFSGTAAS